MINQSYPLLNLVPHSALWRILQEQRGAAYVARPVRLLLPFRVTFSLDVRWRIPFVACDISSLSYYCNGMDSVSKTNLMKFSTLSAIVRWAVCRRWWYACVDVKSWPDTSLFLIEIVHCFFSAEHRRHDGEEDLRAEPVSGGAQEGDADARARLRRGRRGRRRVFLLLFRQLRTPSVESSKSESIRVTCQMTDSFGSTPHFSSRFAFAIIIEGIHPDTYVLYKGNGWWEDTNCIRIMFLLKSYSNLSVSITWLPERTPPASPSSGSDGFNEIFLKASYFGHSVVE